MSRTARIRIATILTVVLIAALSTAGLLVRGSAGASATQQPVAGVTTSAPQPSALPAVAEPSLTVAGEEDEGYEEDDEEGDEDDDEEGFDDD